MITSSVNQYLRAEYLSPIQGNSIELDAKKSPLALLAQTCSQIGADAPQKNSNISPAEKHSKGKSPSGGSKSPSSTSLSSDEAQKGSSASSFKPYEKKRVEDEDDRAASPAKRATPGSKSPPSSSSADLPRTASRGSEGGGRGASGSHESSAPLSTSSLTSTSSTSRGSPLSTKTTAAVSHSLSSLGDLSKDPLAAYKLNSGLYPHLGLGLDPLAGAGLSALTAKVSSNSSGSGSSLASPYIGYAKVKTVSGTEVVVPVCRDPYCTGCQINTHALQVVNGTCPPACSQCAQLAAHTKALSALPTSLLPTIPTSSLTSLYPTSALLGGSQHNVCSWVSGDTYCGKRFSTSEELLQHLRSHTNLSSTETTSSLSISPLHHHPLLAGHPALPRGYPTPPLSPLSAARYHPYAKASLSHLSHAAPLPSAAAVSALSAASLSALTPHPLSAYYNPYSLYARGLGATAGIHP